MRPGPYLRTAGAVLSLALLSLWFTAALTTAKAQPAPDAADPAVEQAVLAANATYYQAFAARDLAGMAAIWAEENIGVSHPGWPRIDGRREVMHSWRLILSHPRAPDISFSEPRVRLFGDTAAVTVTEHLPGDSRLRALNVFAVQQDGTWRMVDHRALPVIPETEI